MIFKTIIYSFYLLFATTSVFASNTSFVYQDLPNSLGGDCNECISGIIKDNTTNEPIENAVITLIDKKSLKQVNSSVTNDKGIFIISNTAIGEYKLIIANLGYETTILDNIVLVNQQSLNVGEIKLILTTRLLNNVIVTGERQLYEVKADRFIYNADKDISNKAGSAADVLRKSPLLTVDLEGNVLLRGTGNIRVLINNKPSSTFATSVADGLRQIPADQIKTVEVITNPSAKYDADGVGGIVNIILKKNKDQGFNGSVNATAGNRYNNLNTRFNYLQSKVGINATLGSFAYFNRNKSQINRFDYPTDEIQTRIIQSNDAKNQGSGINGQLGLDYNPSPKNSITFGIRNNMFNFKSSPRIATSVLSNTSDEYTRLIDNRNKNNSFNANAAYVLSLNKPGREMSVLAQHDINHGRNRYNLNEFRNNLSDYLEVSSNSNNNRESTLQADYTHPVDSLKLLELGAKMIWRDVDSDYNVEADQGTGFQPQLSRSNQFQYIQNVYGIYTNYSFQLFKKYDLRVGSRLENTRLVGNFITNDTAVQQNYTNFFPSLRLSRSFGKESNNNLSLSYARRIQRPAIFFLNPYVNASDPRNIISGNPNLRPELTDSYELTYSKFLENTSFTASFYSRHTSNSIEIVSDLIPTRRFVLSATDTARSIYSTFNNVAQSSVLGTNIFASTSLTPKWRINGGFDLSYINLKSNSLNTRNSGLIYNFNVSSSLDLSNGYSTQFYGSFNSSTFILQGKLGGTYYTSFTIEKELFKQKGSVNFSVNNPFTRAIRYRNSLITEQSSLLSTNYFYNRGVRVNFSYRFGKADNRRRVKKTIINDDQKVNNTTNQ